MNIKNNNELLSCSVYIEQPSNSVNEKGNCESNQKATPSLKSLALQVLKSNQQGNFKATDTKSQSNFATTNNHQKLHEFIFKTYRLTLTHLQKFLGDDWQDYVDKPESLKLWAEMLSKKEVMVSLNVLTRKQYENLFN